MQPRMAEEVGDEAGMPLQVADAPAGEVAQLGDGGGTSRSGRALGTSLHGVRLRQRGPAPRRADSEVLTMELVGEFLGVETDAGIEADSRRHHAALLPHLLHVHRTTFVRQAANLRVVKRRLSGGALTCEPPYTGTLWRIPAARVAWRLDRCHHPLDSAAPGAARATMDGAVAARSRATSNADATWANSASCAGKSRMSARTPR